MSDTKIDRRYRCGDVREDGMVFRNYRKDLPSGEYWVTPEHFALLKLKASLNARVRYDLKRESMPQKPKHLKWKPAKRVFRYRIIQKEFDKPAYPFTPSCDMNPSELTVIPNYSKFAMAPNGDVFRVDPAKRGRTAGMNNRVTPVIHPKGHQWYVQITDDFGVRRRVGVKKLMFALFGQSETIA